MFKNTNDGLIQMQTGLQGFKSLIPSQNIPDRVLLIPKGFSGITWTEHYGLQQVTR